MVQPIAVLVTDGFEDSEYTEPVEALKAAGYSIVNIDIEKDKAVYGKKRQTPVRIDAAVRDVQPQDFTALLIPGGHAPDALRGDAGVQEFVRAFDATGRPIFTICHGPHVLVSAEVVRGRKITCVSNIAIDLQNAGAEYVDATVVIDGNRLVSSRTPKDLPQFIDAVLDVLASIKK